MSRHPSSRRGSAKDLAFLALKLVLGEGAAVPQIGDAREALVAIALRAARKDPREHEHQRSEHHEGQDAEQSTGGDPHEGR